MEYLFFSLTFDFSNVFLKGIKLEKNKMINQLSNEDGSSIQMINDQI